MGDLQELYEESTGGHHGSEAAWISLSDLMSSLMLIFMLLAIAFMMKTEQDSQQLVEMAEKARQDAVKMQQIAKQTEQDAQQVKDIAVIYQQVRDDLYRDLDKEFHQDFINWGATLNPDLSIRFNNEYILFNRGETALKPSFQQILGNFFPRYIALLTSAKYKNSIQEIRIEGHTSSIWGETTSPQEAYFNNMELSQARTRSALRYMLDLPPVQKESSWLRKFVTANGLSSSRPVLNADGTENEALSQRVEFRIRTDAESKINTILQTSVDTKASTAITSPQTGWSNEIMPEVQSLFGAPSP